METNTTASIDLAQLDKLIADLKAAGLMDDQCGNALIQGHGVLMDLAWLKRVVDFARRSLTSGAPAEPATMPCEDCDGRGHDGDFQWQGHFQPPEPGICNSCGGSGKWLVSESAGAAAKSEQAPNAVRAQIEADAECILRLLDTVDKLVGSTSGATERIQEHAQHIIQFAGKIGSDRAAAAGAGSAQPEALDGPSNALSNSLLAEIYKAVQRGDSVERVHSAVMAIVYPALTQQAGAAAPSREDARLTDEQYREVLRPVLSRYGMQRYLNGDSITLDPSDYRAIIDRAALARAPLPAQGGALAKAARDYLDSVNRMQSEVDWSSASAGALSQYERTRFALQKIFAASAQPVDDARDTARLDWLESNQATLSRLYNNTGYILAVDGKAVRTDKSARAAIDAAMRANDSSVEGGNHG